jgi:hypothetical protein
VDLTADLLYLQAEAESRMLDTCRITRADPDADNAVDPVTGLPAAGTRTTVYEGKCRLRTPGTVSTGSTRQSAGDVITSVTPILSVPISAPAAWVDDRVEMLTSVNPAVVGLRLTVSGLVPSSQITAQRVSVTAVID